MSLFGSLYASAGGMMAQSRSTAVISNNIANFTTVGYKRDDVSFNDLISPNGRYSNSSVGGAKAEVLQRVRQQGNIQQTSSSTDLGVVGDGFFIVSTSATPGAEEFVYTRAGQFSEDASGILQNTAGYNLYGYTTDTDGVAQGDGLGSLVPIDLNVFETQFLETDTIDLAINLDAEDSRINPHAADTAQQLPINNLGASYSRDVTVYDDAGNANVLSFAFRKTIGPMAHFSSNTGLQVQRSSVLVDNAVGPTPNIVTGDQFVISDGTNAVTIDFVNTAADTSLNQANTTVDVLEIINGVTNVDGDPVFLASISETNQLLVQARNPAATLDLTGTSASVLNVGGLNIIPDPDTPSDYIYEPDFDITVPPTATDAYPGQGDLPAISDPANTNPYAWWELTVSAEDALGNPVVVTQGLMNFDGTGVPNATPDANGDLTLTLSADDLPFNSTAGLAVDMSRITQKSGIYQTIELTQNGAPAGDRRGISITPDGTVFLEFSNNITVPVYKIPLALFNNPDGLERIDGTAYRVPADGQSGEPRIALAQVDGAGSVNQSSLENSTVDIANEFGNLIVTQRAYSLNSQVVEAINEMTQNLSRLKG